MNSLVTFFPKPRMSKPSYSCQAANFEFLLRKGWTAVVKALRLELFVALAGMQVNESHPLASEMLTPPLEIGAFYLRNRYKEIPLYNFLIFKK